VPVRRTGLSAGLANVIASDASDLIGAIGRRVLDNLLPDRRLCVSPPHRQASDFQIPDQCPSINQRSYEATFEINIFTAGLDTPAQTPTTWPWA
jgi:hypothetical protein